MYLIDTNILLEGSRRYPVDIFPGYWDTLEELAATGKIFFHEKVIDEARNWQGEDHAKDWLEQRVVVTAKLKADDAEIASYRQVTKWAVSRRGKQYLPKAVTDFLNAADSWLVAAACNRNFTIVTYEVSAPKSKARIKLPDAANSFDVRCIDPIQMLRNENVVVK